MSQHSPDHPNAPMLQPQKSGARGLRRRRGRSGWRVRRLKLTRLRGRSRLTVGVVGSGWGVREYERMRKHVFALSTYREVTLLYPDRRTNSNEKEPDQTSEEFPARKSPFQSFAPAEACRRYKREDDRCNRIRSPWCGNKQTITALSLASEQAGTRSEDQQSVGK